MRSLADSVLDLVEIGWVSGNTEEEDESMILSPGFYQPVIPHAQCVWIDVDIFERD